MESWNLLSQGIVAAVQPTIFLAILFGVTVGLLIGALPGLGPSAGVAILLPIVVNFDGTAAIAALGAVYYGAQYGSAVTAILLGIPGDSSSIMTVLDGYPLAKQGKAGIALSIAVAASFIGGLIGLILLTTFATTIAGAALSFGPIEMTAMMIFALALVSILGSHDRLKSFIALFVGIAVGTIGLDPIIGTPRFTYGETRLFEGIAFSVMAVGLFGLAEMFVASTLNSKEKSTVAKFRVREVLPNFSAVRETWSALLSGSLIGFLIGVLPGIGSTASAMIAYAVGKRTSKNPDDFGKGALAGIAAPESANNSASYGSMIPMFALGVPGSGTTAVLLGGLFMVGLQPGPLLFSTQPEFVWTVFGSFYIGNLALVFIAIAMMPLLASTAFVRPSYLYPFVFGIVVFGIYSIQISLFDVLVVCIFGILGYLFKKLSYPTVPLLIGVILGPLLERGIRRTLVASGGDYGAFFHSWIAIGLFSMTAALFLIPIIMRWLSLSLSPGSPRLKDRS